MKTYNLTLLFILAFGAVFSQTRKQSVKIENIRFEVENYIVNVKFNIVNMTQDTLYISERNIDIQLIKKSKLIKWEYPKVDIHPFVKSVLKNKTYGFENKTVTSTQDNIRDKLANCFANKLFLKNLKVNKEFEKHKNVIVENIVEDCIVLLPLETYDYEKGFYSKKIDKTCKVSVKYLRSKRFTYFVNDNGKKIDINN